MEKSTDYLRKQLQDLQQTDRVPISTEINDLDNLMQSIGVGIHSENKDNIGTKHTSMGSVGTRTFESSSQHSASSWNNRWKDNVSGVESDDSFTHASERQYESGYGASSRIPNAVVDTLDYTVVKFGSDCVLRGKLGRYLAAAPISVSVDTEGSSTHQQQQQTVYSLEITGQGIGEPLDCLNFISIDHKDDVGPMKYGMTVAIKSPAAKERLLGTRDGDRLGFWRHLIGQGEKFQILKPTISSYSSNSAAVGGAKGLEEPNSRGKYIRIGDVVMIQTFKSERLLSLHEGINGVEARLVLKDRTGFGSELWQLEQFGAIPLPTWYQSRPYLSGRYLAIPPSVRSSTAEIESRMFPRSNTIQPTTPVLSTLTVSAQQLILLRDMLLVLSGVEGQHIRVAASPSREALQTDDRNTSARFAAGKSTSPSSTTSLKVSEISLVLDVDNADKSVVEQVMLLFPICECAIRIREFIKLHSRYEFGYVSHALCAAIKQILREFDILIAQFEHKYLTDNLSLQTLIYALQPSKITLATLDRLCKNLLDKVGGRMIDELHHCMLQQGDSQARQLHHYLLMQASKPFLKMLSLWIFRGELQDPYKEFMVYEDTSVSKEALEEDFNAQYWETRYTLRDEHVPRILKNYAFKALTAGKYLHVVRGCMAGSTNSSSNKYNNNYAAVDVTKYSSHKAQPEQWRLPEEKELLLSLEVSDNALALEIEQAYLFSSRALLKLLEDTHKLSTHVRSLRRFFLLEHGDFFIQFMDTAEDDLRREVGDVVLSRIQGLLQLAVQTSTLSTDPNREDLTCTLASHNLIQHLDLIQTAGSSTVSYANLTSQGLKGVEAFTLDYKVGWPLSIVLSRRAVTKYQLLSRLLYFSKHVERRVLTSWMGHQATKELNVRAHMSLSYCLRHRMLHFLQNFVYYMTFEVINPRSHELQEAMQFAEDMDEVMELHEKFLDSCLNECLLASQELLKTLTKLMTTCLLFADHMTKFTADEEAEHSTHEADRVAQAEADLVARNIKRADSSGNMMRTSSGKFGKSTVPVLSAMQQRQQRMRDQAEFIERETSHESFQRILSKFSDTFDSQLKEFLNKLCTDNYRGHGQLSNLCVRLDYNGFYTSTLN